MADVSDERVRVLALLRHNHEFPCAYNLKAIVRAGESATVVSTVAATGVRILSVDERESRTGAYLSVRFRVHVPSAESVLEVYDTLSRLDSVVTTL